MKSHTAFISAGSNIGDKYLNCKKGIAALAESGISVLMDQSRFYLTEPVDYKPQDWFINSVVKIKTVLNPFELLNELKRIERDAGRSYSGVRFGPRILDLDIIMYDDLIINSSRLFIPHIRMHKRLFVLKPFCDIEPCAVHPVIKKDMEELLKSLDDNTQRIKLYC